MGIHDAKDDNPLRYDYWDTSNLVDYMENLEYSVNGHRFVEAIGE